jgi:hypothetical protein
MNDWLDTPAGKKLDESAGRRNARTAGLGELGARTDGTRVGLSLTAVARAIWIAVGALIVATFVSQLARDASGPNTAVILFDSDQKLNFPSALKILLLLSATTLFAVLGMAVRDRWHRRRWLGMGAVFTVLTMDEMTYMHQRLSDTLHDLFDTGGPLRFAWILVYLPLIAALVVVYWPLWRKLANPFRTQLLVAAVLFAGGSGGIEVFKAALFDEDHWKLSFGLVASLSDSLELLGLALLVTALLTVVRSVIDSATVSFES